MRALLLLLALATAPAQDAIDPIAALEAQLSTGDWRGAANGASALLDDPEAAALHGRAWAVMGRALEGWKLPYGGLVAHWEGVQLDPAGTAPNFEAILALTESAHEDAVTGGILSKDLAVEMSADTRSHVALLGARHHFQSASWGQTLGLLAVVDSQSAWGLDADVLQGVTLTQQSRYGEALVPLLTAQARARDEKRDAHYQNMVSLNIARTFFASGNFGRAMEYYDQVDRSDAWWPQSHFERAWAHFRVQDMPGTLGLLHTHGSPFFEDWYLPEADLLRAQALFLMCKFPQATKEIDAFQGGYQPVLDELGGLIGSLDADQAWNDTVQYLESGGQRIPTMLLRNYKHDARVADTRDALRQIDSDLAKLAKLQTEPFAERVHGLLTARRSARVQREGHRILEHLRSAQAELADMLEGIELTRIDLLTLEAELYSRAARTGTLDVGNQADRLRRHRRKGKQVWPFQGEYWADELGWYRVDSRPDCPDAMSTGERG